MNRYIFTFFVLLCISNLQAAELRSWVGSNGKVIEAAFVSFDGKIVKLKTPAGKELNVLLSLFSKEDQDFVKNGGKETTDDPFGEESTSIPKRSEFKPPQIDKQAAYLAIIKELEKALKEAKHPHSIFTIHTYLTCVQVMAGQKEAAKKNFEKAKELSDKDVQKQNVHYLAIAEAYLGNYNEAKSKAKSFATFNYIADIMTKQGAIDEAKTTLMENVTLITKEPPENLLHTDGMKALKDWAYYQTASQQAKSGFFEEAKVTSAKIEPPIARFMALCEIGKYQLLVEKIGEAQNTFSIASTLNIVYEQYRIAAAWANAGYIEKAFEFAKQDNDPQKQSLILQSVPRRQIIEGKIDDAKKNLAKTLSFMEKNYSIAVIYIAIDDEKTAEQILKSASELIEQNPNLEERARSLLDLARYQSFLISIDTVKPLLNRSFEIVTNDSIKGDCSKTSEILRRIAQCQDFLGDEKSSLATYNLSENEAHKIQDVQQREKLIGYTVAMRNSIGYPSGYFRMFEYYLNPLFHIKAKLITGKFDEGIKLSQRIQSPVNRAEALNAIAEELYGQKD